MRKSPVRILIVEDFEQWRQFYCSMLQKQPEFQVIGEVSDGLEAVDQARKLQPDLILLDIGLPTLNGIEAARRIREISGTSKILFLSENRSSEIVEDALNAGAGGYVVKSDAARELLPAINAVLEGRRFLSTILRGNESSVSRNESAATVHRRHEVAFYQDEASLLDGYAQFIRAAAQDGSAVILVTTESQRNNLVTRLNRSGLDVAGAIAQGTLVLFDSFDALASLMVDNMPEPTRCSNLVSALIARAAKGVNQERGRVAFCGGIAPILLSNGNVEGAIRLEQLWDQVTRGYGVQTLCGYIRTASEHIESSPILKRICGAHSAVHNVGY